MEYQGVKEYNQKAFRIRNNNGSYRNIWNFAMVYVTGLISLTAFKNTKLRGKTNYEVLTGDISNILFNLEFYCYNL